MDINKPDTVAEVTAAFEAYERALMANDVDALVGDFFWEDPRVLRYSMGVNSYGPDEIRAARTRIPSADRTSAMTTQQRTRSSRAQTRAGVAARARPGLAFQVLAGVSSPLT
jgi:ketosteroid isomerase-like protein